MNAADVLGDAFEIPPEWIRCMLGPTFPELPGADVFPTRRKGTALAAAAPRPLQAPGTLRRPVRGAQARSSPAS